MCNNRSLSFALTLLALSAAPPPSSGYIHFPPTTMQRMCKESSNIRVMTVKKFDKEQGVIVYELAETLKGQSPKLKSFKHVIGKEDKSSKPIFEWLGEKKQVVMFTIEWNSQACGYVFIDEFCYSVDYNSKGDYWQLIRVDPEMAATFYGSVAQLQKVSKELLEGKEVKIPVKEGLKPLTIKERETIFPLVNENIKKNRKE